MDSLPYKKRAEHLRSKQATLNTAIGSSRVVREQVRICEQIEFRAARRMTHDPCRAQRSPTSRVISATSVSMAVNLGFACPRVPGSLYAWWTNSRESEPRRTFRRFLLFVLFCVLLHCLMHASVCISSSEALTSLTSSQQTLIEINSFDQLVTKTYPRLRRFNR